MTARLTFIAGLLASAMAAPATAALPEATLAAIDTRAEAVEPKLIAWRRDIHQHPELGNAEHRTAALVAAHLRKLGLEVRTGVAGTGVVGVLKGGKPGPVVALRADMDALPVAEQTGLLFASKAKGVYQGAEVDVMHACGHDAHVAILMAAAEVLAGMRETLPGTVTFLFQPAEETPADFKPDGVRDWGAKRMIREGALDTPKVDAIFGLHVGAGAPSGQLAWRAGPAMAGADSFAITVKGKQTHGAMPWSGVDPIVLSAQIVLGIQTIASRQLNLTREPAVISIGKIAGGNRINIIPDAVTLEGTVRVYDRAMQADIRTRLKRTAESIAASGGGGAETEVIELYRPTVNDPALTARMEPVLRQVAGTNWAAAPLSSASEDFSFYQEKVPGLYLSLGVTPPDKIGKAAPNHSPLFEVDESALRQGVRALTALAVDYLESGGK